MDELVTLLKNKRENEVDLDHISNCSNLNPSQIPVLHPEIFKINDFYQGGAKPNKSQSADCQISVEQLLSFQNINRFQCLVGPPGVGKSTLSRRLVKNQQYKLSLYLRFAEINYNSNLTLQEFLFNKQFVKFGFTPEKCKKVFFWLLSNQSKCLLVLDGLDQAQLDLSKEPAHEEHSERLNVSTIIACLFKKIFLPQVRIIVTSRPHALLPLHHSLRPDNIYQVQGLSPEDTRTLLRCFAGERFEDLSLKLKQLGPELEDMCRCPLLLQMFFLSQMKPSRSIGEATTITRIFATVLESLQRSKNSRTDFQKVHVKLARLAHNTFIKNQIMITWAEVKKEDLEENEINDLIIIIPGYEGICFKMLDSDKTLFFSHQLFHEYYCAWHVCNMTDDDFRRTLEEAKYDHNFDAVKKFIYGLVCDINESQSEFPTV